MIQETTVVWANGQRYVSSLDMSVIDDMLQEQNTTGKGALIPVLTKQSGKMYLGLIIVRGPYTLASINNESLENIAKYAKAKQDAKKAEIDERMKDIPATPVAEEETTIATNEEVAAPSN